MRGCCCPLGASGEPQTQSCWVWFCCLLKTGLCAAVMENPISVPIKALLPWLLLLADAVSLVFMEKYLLGRPGWRAGFVCFRSALVARMLLGDPRCLPPYPPTSPPAAGTAGAPAAAPFALYRGRALRGTGLASSSCPAGAQLCAVFPPGTLLVAARLDGASGRAAVPAPATAAQHLGAAGGLKGASLMHAITQTRSRCVSC